MRPLNSQPSALTVVLATALITAGAAQACGPMDAGPAPSISRDTGGAPPGSSPPGGSLGSGSSNGGDAGGWDNGGAQRMRQGADDAARGADSGDDGGRRFGGGSSTGAGGGGADFSSQISSLRTPEAKPDPPPEPPPPEEYDGHTGGGNVWWNLLTGDNGLEHSLTDKFNADHPVVDPRVEAELDKPWYQRASEAWQAINQPGHDIPETGGGNSVWWTILTGDNGLEHSLQPPPDTSPQAIERAEQWKAYNDLPWYQRWTTPDPDYHPPPPKPPYPPALNQPRMGRNG